MRADTWDSTWGRIDAAAATHSTPREVPARGRILSSWTPPPSAGSSWEGGTGPGAINMREAVHYVLSLPVSTIIIGCDSVAQLEENIQLARTFTPLNDTQMASLVERTQPVHRQALFFRRWG